MNDPIDIEAKVEAIHQDKNVPIEPPCKPKGKKGRRIRRNPTFSNRNLDWKQARMLKLQGMTDKDIAVSMGVSLRTVQIRWVKMGMKEEMQAIDKLNKSNHTSNLIIKNQTQDMKHRAEQYRSRAAGIIEKVLERVEREDLVTLKDAAAASIVLKTVNEPAKTAFCLDDNQVAPIINLQLLSNDNELE